jgi:hypothetical protein
MIDFQVYVQAVVDYLNGQGKNLLFAVYGDRQDIFTITWFDTADAVTFTDTDIQPFYDAIIASALNVSP